MARVPVVRGPRVGPEVVRPLGGTFQDVGPTAGAFGEAEARAAGQTVEALGQAGQAAARVALELQEADNRLQAREDSLSRIRALAQARQEAQELVTAAEAGSDLSVRENVAALRARVGQAFDLAEQGFGGEGLPDNRLIFMEDMARLRAQFDADLVNRGVRAGNAAMDAELEQKVSELTQLVETNPAALPDAQAELTLWIDRNYARTKSAAEEVAARQAGMETIATAAVDFLIAGRQYDEALVRMSQPSVRAFLSEDRARELRMRIFAGQGQEAKVRAEVETKLDVVRSAGVEITPQIAVAAATGINITQSRGPRTIPEKVAEFEATMQRATGNQNFSATPEQVAKISGAATGEDRPFGGGERGRARALVADLNEEFRAGTISPEDAVLYMGAVAAIRSIDPVTQTQGELDLPTREALEAQGISPALITSPEGVSQFQELRQRLTGQEAVESVSEAGEFSVGGALPAPQQQEGVVADVIAAARGPVQQMTQAVEGTALTGQDPLEAMAATGIKFFDVVDLITGPISSAGARLAGTPFLGKLLQAPEMRQLRQNFALMKPKVASILRRSERYADAERQDLFQRLESLDSQFFVEPLAVRDDMIGIDNALDDEERHIRETLEEEGLVSGERFRDFKDRLNDIIFVRQVMGVPPLVSTEEELMEVIRRRGLKPGDKVRWKGKVMVIQGEQAAGEEEEQ